MPLVHAFDLLTKPSTESVTPLVISVGGDQTLRTWVRGIVATGDDVTELDGDVATWETLHDDLLTPSLFDMGERRTVLVRTADPFIKKYRESMERYAAAPSSASRLILEVDSLPANVRLHKIVVRDNWLVECKVPARKTRFATQIDMPLLREFLQSYVAPRHQCGIHNDAIDLLVELLGEELGMLDTEIAKLALFVPLGGKITIKLVQEVTSGWRGKSMWDIIDSIAKGDTAEALQQVDKLFSSGERALALLPQLAWSLRRLGVATAVVDAADSRRVRLKLSEALQQAGFRNFGNEIKNAEKQLVGLGRERARQILPWLLEADLKLKGTHSSPKRETWVMEELLLKLAVKP